MFYLLLFLGQKASTNKFTKKDVFICKDAKTSKGVGLETNPKHFCYLWETPNNALISDPTAPNPTLLTLPKASFAVTVTVFDDNGDVFVEVSNIFIYEIKLEIWQPKWMSLNQVNLPSLSQPLQIAQTFVNTDNDDNDDFFDIDDKDIPKGDNELVPIKAYLRLIGADFPTILGDETANKGVILKPDRIDADLLPILGANTVKIWKAESKSILFDTYKLSTQNKDFVTETIANIEWLTFKGWIEGVVAHTAPLQAQFGFAVGNDISADGGCNAKKVALTVAAVTSIDWIGIGNGEDNDKYTSNDLCGKNNSATSCRVFPDGRFENGAVSASKDKVNIKITLSTALNDPFTLYVKSFDMDDPSQNKADIGVINRPPSGTLVDKLILDPNDDLKNGTYEGGQGLIYTVENDNRATKKIGTMRALQGVNSDLNNDDTFEAYFKPNQKELKDIVFQVSQFAGDNYQLFAYCDKAHLQNLYNTDHLDGSKIVDLCISGKRLDCTEGISKVLTVWRLLHLEIDGMSDFDWTENQINNLFRDVVTNTNGDIIEIKMLTKSLRDESADIDSPFPTSQGRFENGTIVFSTLPPIKKENIVKENGEFRAVFKVTTPLSLNGVPCWFKSSTSSISTFNYVKNVKKIVNGYRWEFINSDDFSNFDILNVAENSNLVIEANMKIIQKGTNYVITENIGVPFIIRDDDNQGILPFGQIQMNDTQTNLKEFSKITFAKTYLLPVFDGGGVLDFNKDDFPYIRNLGDSKNPEPDVVTSMKDWNNILGSRQSSNLEKDNYWVSHLMGGHQTNSTSDGDPNFEGATYGITDTYNYIVNSTDYNAPRKLDSKPA
jgi:hypothetical protein